MIVVGAILKIRAYIFVIQLDERGLKCWIDLEWGKVLDAQASQDKVALVAALLFFFSSLIWHKLFQSYILCDEGIE